MSRLLGSWLGFLVALAACTASAQPTPPELWKQLWSGQVDSALAGFESQALAEPKGGPTDASEAWVEALLASCRYAEAERALKALDTKAQKGNRRAALLRGEWLLATGDAKGAVAALESVLRSEPSLHRARLALGRAQRAAGRHQDAHRTLDRMADEWLEGRLSGAPDLTHLAHALWETGHFKNAHEIFGKATKEDPTHLPAEVGWGWLFVAKYNYRDADESFEKVLAAAPLHPEAVAGMARIDLLSDNDPRKAAARLEKALAAFPGCALLHRGITQVHIYDERWDRALHSAEAALAVNRRDVENWSALATVQFLRDDSPGFDASVKSALALDPKFARIYTDAAEAGERVHRYEEIVALFERALALDPDLPAAHVGLGIGYSRLGDDTKARHHLDLAYELDPYNVRAVNLSTQFYDTVIREFEWVDRGALRHRFHRTEKPVLELHLPNYLEQSRLALSARYGFEPHGPIHFEIFPDPELFSVRTTGLPRMGAHGVCFGRVITARSPSEGNFNWKQVLYHELAHVYHLQMSRARVPRWFTEGLAVHETRIVRPVWAQAMDRELFAALERGGLAKVADFNLAFTQARSIEDILLAYYQASVFVQFLEERWGFGALRQMLVSWGERKSTPQVLKETTQLHPDALDAEFAAWLRIHLARYEGDLSLDLTNYRDIEARRAAATASPESGRLQAELALAEMAAGNGDAAEQALQRALGLSPKEPFALLLQAQFAWEQKAPAKTLQALDALFEAGTKSLQGRLLAGQAAVRQGQHEAAARHFEAALAIEPASEMAIRGLLAATEALLEKTPEKTPEEAPADQERQRWLKRLIEVSASDAESILRVSELDDVRSDSAEFARLGDLGLEIAPFSPSVVVLAARAAGLQGQWDRARSLLLPVLDLRPEPAQAALLKAWLAMAELEQGRPAEAERLAKEALALQPDQTTAKEVLSRL